MKTTKVKAAGYIRVSGKDQINNQSLTTQQQSIKSFIKQHDYKLTEIYSDEGISGGSVKDRHALLRCLYDGQDGKFNVLIIHRLSRFGRNARELLDNHEELKRAGVELRSISEGIDFSTKYGQAFLGILAVIAQLERDIIRETMLENRIAIGQRGIPTSGKLPYGRTFDRATGKWKLDQDKVRQIQRAADEFLAGGSLFDIAKTIPMSYVNLIDTLRKKCGDRWTVTFQGEEPITYDIPRILSDEMIQMIHDRLEFNRKNNRTDITNKYVLSGFIRCEHCGRTLNGQTQAKHGAVYKYYSHERGKRHECKAFSSIALDTIERAVFETIFENFNDVPSFEKAISESMPDEKMILNLELEIKADEKELKTINRELDKLVELALSGTLNKETIKGKEQTLIEAKAEVTERLERNRDKLLSLPDVNEVRKEAETVRRQLLEQFSGKERLQEMTFDEKRTLLHWLFDGKDQYSASYGIYINKRGKGKNQMVDYFMYGKITGLRTVKGDDINYQRWDEDEGIQDKNIQNYKTNKVTFENWNYKMAGLRISTNIF